MLSRKQVFLLLSVAVSTQFVVAKPASYDSINIDPLDSSQNKDYAESSIVVSSNDGGPAGLGEYPYFAHFRFFDDISDLTTFTNCGGTLISPNVILSAAHCNPNNTKELIQVAIGNVDKFDITKGGEIKNCTNWYNHPDFDPTAEADGTTGGWDFALCHFETAVDETNIPNNGININLELNDEPSFPSLSQPTEFGDPNSTNVTIMGMGFTNSFGIATTDTLISLIQQIEDQEKCEGKFVFLRDNSATISDSIFCGIRTGGSTGGMCGGDSGGPVVSIVEGDNATDVHTLLGVLSFGAEPRCGKNAEGYARVSSGMQWIRKKVCTDLGYSSLDLCNTKAPSEPPSNFPSTSPSNFPSTSHYPSVLPSNFPSGSPSDSPTLSPTALPSVSPTKRPTFSPTKNPKTLSPTALPSVSPTKRPTFSPTFIPTASPTKAEKKGVKNTKKDKKNKKKNDEQKNSKK